MDESAQDLQKELKNKIALGELLRAKTCAFNNVDGITYLESYSEECNAVLQNFPLAISYCDDDDSEEEIPFGATLEEGTSRITVDVVMKQGQQWVKVIARNPRALSQLSTGAGKFGQKTVLDQAEQFVLCASQHPVVFAFSNGIEETLAKLLEVRGVVVEGDRIPDSSPHHWEELEPQTIVAPISRHPENSLQRLNLDVSTMVAFVSALTNGRSGFVFQQPLLTQQAEWERARPVIPVLDNLFQGKQLFCCQSAHRDFRNIVDTMGGPGEKVRTVELLSRVTVVPDQCPPRVAALNLSGKIKQRSQIVFGTGDALQALTVSANEGFVRGARNQGVEFAVFLHESRALSEVKESQAVPFSENSSNFHSKF
ncbi:hypothetical protein B566_EDAN001752 [Ephemera danica]|nr:hypothetical protein B566_EDAN001752 [Ephemera danica]